MKKQIPIILYVNDPRYKESIITQNNQNRPFASINGIDVRKIAEELPYFMVEVDSKDGSLIGVPNSKDLNTYYTTLGKRYDKLPDGNWKDTDGNLWSRDDSGNFSIVKRNPETVTIGQNFADSYNSIADWFSKPIIVAGDENTLGGYDGEYTTTPAELILIASIPLLWGKPILVLTTLGGAYAGGAAGEAVGKGIAYFSSDDPGILKATERAGEFIGSLAGGSSAMSKIYPKMAPSLNYFQNLPQGTKNIISDVTHRPISTLKARLHGEYPITISERRNYIEARRKAIENGIWFNNRKHLKTASLSLFNLWRPLPKYRDISRNVAKNFDLSEGALAYYSPKTNEIVIARRNLGSNLPQNYMYKKGLDNLEGLGAHESYHWLMTLPLFYITTTPEKALSVYSINRGYDIPNINNSNLLLSPFGKNIERNDLYELEGLNFNNSSFKIWSNSPEEFAADKANLDVLGISPAVAKLKLSYKFEIPRKEAATKYTWLKTNGYKAGGKIPSKYTTSDLIKKLIIKYFNK